MAKNILKKHKKKLRKLVFNDESTEDEVIPDSPVPNTPVRSNVETYVHVTISIVSSKVSTPEQIILTPPPVSTI